jgi:predicted nucleotidyltransferase
LSWDLETIRAALSVTPLEAAHTLRALEAADLARPLRRKGSKTWTTTSHAQAFASATAAKPVTRQTAKRVLSEFLDRVDRVNRDHRFLAKVTRVILFGSYLRSDINRLSDVDFATQLEPKEKDREILRQLNHRRVAQLERKGHRPAGILACWRSEAFRFLKGRSRSVSVLDYKRERKFVDRVPHRILLCTAEDNPEPIRRVPKQFRVIRRPKGGPF